MRRLSAPSCQSRSQHLPLRIVDRISHYFLAVTQTKTRPTEHQKGFTKRISPVKLTVTPHIGDEGHVQGPLYDYLKSLGVTQPVNRRPIGTPDRHPIGTPSSYVSGD